MHSDTVKGWEYKIIGGDGAEYGPVSLDGMREWIEDGRVDSSTYVWRNDEARWQHASAWSELQWDLPVSDGQPPISDVSLSAPVQDEEMVPAPLPPLHPRASEKIENYAVPPPLSHSSVQDTVVLQRAGFLPRFGAYFLDWMLVVFIATLLTVPWSQQLSELQQAAWAQLKNPNPDMDVTFRLWWISLSIHFPISLLYHVGCNTRWGATPGKWVLGLHILDVANRPLTFDRALVRFLAEGLCLITFFFGYLLILFNPARQGLHDRIAGTQVVHRTRRSWTSPQTD